MKKHCHAVLLLAVMVVLPMLQLSLLQAQDELFAAWSSTKTPGAAGRVLGL